MRIKRNFLIIRIVTDHGHHISMVNNNNIIMANMIILSFQIFYEAALVKRAVHYWNMYICISFELFYKNDKIYGIILL